MRPYLHRFIANCFMLYLAENSFACVGPQLIGLDSENVTFVRVVASPSEFVTGLVVSWL